MSKSDLSAFENETFLSGLSPTNQFWSNKHTIYTKDFECREEEKVDQRGI